MINTRKQILISLLIFFVTSSIADSSFDVAIPSVESASQKKRMRKPKEKQKKKKKSSSYKDMTYEELVVAKDAMIAKSNITSAIKYLEQMMKLCTDITKLAEHLLEIADLLFQDGQFQKAAQLYTNFSSFYPGSEKQEYALYRAIVSSSACTLSVERDQTKTEETVALTDIFLKQDHFTAYRQEVVDIQLQCYEKLAASECNICSFYVTRNRFTAAQKRVDKLRSMWLPKLPEIEADILALETELAFRKEEIELLHTQQMQVASLSQDKKSKKSKRMIERF